MAVGIRLFCYILMGLNIPSQVAHFVACHVLVFCKLDSVREFYVSDIMDWIIESSLHVGENLVLQAKIDVLEVKCSYFSLSLLRVPLLSLLK